MRVGTIEAKAIREGFSQLHARKGAVSRPGRHALCDDAQEVTDLRIAHWVYQNLAALWCLANHMGELQKRE